MNQQQLAATFDFTVWHFTQTSSVSLQESVQRGMQHSAQEVRTRHQTIATPPNFLRGRLAVSFPQPPQGEPVPES